MFFIPAAAQPSMARCRNCSIVWNPRAASAAIARLPPTRSRRPSRGEDLIGRRLQDMAEKLCGGSLTPLLTHLVRTKGLTARERQELRGLIDELDQKGKGKKGPR